MCEKVRRIPGFFLTGIDWDFSGQQERVEDIVMKRAVPAPACAKQLLETLNARSPRNNSGM
jgi:hypothetical protein